MIGVPIGENLIIWCVAGYQPLEDIMHRLQVYGVVIAAVLGLGLPAKAEMVRINAPTIRINPSVHLTTPGSTGGIRTESSGLPTGKRQYLTGKRQHSPITVGREVDAASPVFSK
jgi:hypothetical protein